ncbi:MAG: putative transcriptional regulator [Alphaproteobacteria bacterium]|jgi:putative transcriptional regulator
MTVHHHPGSDLLLSYAAGSLAESWSIAIAAHLSHCSSCRQDIDLAETVGGVLLNDVAAERMAPGALETVLQAIGHTEQDAPLRALLPEGPTPVLPKSVRDYVGGDVNDIVWQRLGKDAFQYLIETRDDDAQARLLRIKAGRPVPRHGHGGRELTLVVAGRFEDEISAFGPGDLEDVDEETVHKPVAGIGEDCICLAVTDAPLRFKEFLPRVLQPILRI